MLTFFRWSGILIGGFQSFGILFGGLALRSAVGRGLPQEVTVTRRVGIDRNNKSGLV